MRWIRVIIAVALIDCTAGVGVAHHGKDFLIVESYDVPEPHEFYLVGSGAIGSQDGFSLELEPSLLVGLFPRVAVELHAHVAKEPDQSLQYEAAAPALHLQLSPPDSDFPIRFGFSAEYEIASNGGADQFETRLIAETEFARWKLVANLLGEHREGGDRDVGYAIGARYDFTQQFACGFEAQGPFTNNERHELIVGGYFEPKVNVTLKVGVGPSIDNDGAGFIARFGIVWRL